MDNQFLENKNKNDNFNKIELLYNKNKYTTLLSEFYKKYLNKNNLELNNKKSKINSEINSEKKNKNNNQLIHLDKFIKNNNIKIHCNNNKKHLNQKILDLIINKIDEYLYLNPINIKDYEILKFTNYQIYNSIEFVKNINEKNKFKKLIKYLDELHENIFEKIKCTFKKNEIFKQYYIINTKYKLIYEKDNYIIKNIEKENNLEEESQNKLDKYFISLLNKEKFKIFHLIIFTLKIKDFTRFIYRDKITYTDSNLNEISFLNKQIKLDEINENEYNKIDIQKNNTDNHNNHDEIENNIHINRMYYNMVKYWLANIFIINNFNTFNEDINTNETLPLKKLLLNHDILFFISGCYYSIDGMVDKEIKISKEYKKILLLLLSRIITKIQNIFFDDKKKHLQIN